MARSSKARSKRSQKWISPTRKLARKKLKIYAFNTSADMTSVWTLNFRPLKNFTTQGFWSRSECLTLKSLIFGVCSKYAKLSRRSIRWVSMIMKCLKLFPFCHPTIEVWSFSIHFLSAQQPTRLVDVWQKVCLFDK